MEERLIANILYKELFSYNVIFLRDICYLSMVHHDATLSSDGSKLTPPYKTIAAYSLDEYFNQYTDVVLAISQSLNVDYESAYAIYSNFISSHIIGNILNIPMVMTINLDDMSILRLDDRIVNALQGQDISAITIANPKPKIQVNTRKYNMSLAYQGTVMLTIAFIIMTAAIIYLLYYFYPVDI